MSKRTYRAISVNDVSIEHLAPKLSSDAPLIVGIDVAKIENKAALVQNGTLVRLVGWKAPKESRQLVGLVRALAQSRRVEVVIESTGTYGDPLRAQLASLKVPVYRVQTKHTHDSAEIFDGVPSSHDAKAALQLTWLHGLGRSKPWPFKTDEERDLAAAAEEYDLYNAQLMMCLGRLEARLARHFPELTQMLALRSATTLALIAQYGSPAEVAADAEAAAALMAKVGGHFLKVEKIAEVITAARNTTGLTMTAKELAALKALANEARRHRTLKAEAKKTLERMAKNKVPIQRVAQVVGLGTAVHLVLEAGNPGTYKSSQAYLKALGLNLKERSSGQHQGLLSITKRGSAKARQVLYLAVGRLIQRDAHFKAWFERKVEREGGKRRRKAVVALMRKLARALVHIARGDSYSPTKLFDAKRLGVTT